MTAWGQQHDPLTLEPVSARSYELTSLAAQESAASSITHESGVAERARRARRIRGGRLAQSRRDFGLAYIDYELKTQRRAGPALGTLYEIGTNRVIMANRDGVKLYDWNKLTDRRSGYAWYTTKPAETLATFKQWSREHPRKP